MSSTYRPPSKPPKSAWARHIDRVMQREGWSQTKAFRAARAALGLGEDSRSAFLPYLIDKEPDDGQAKALASVFGWPEAEDQAPKPEPPPDMASALNALVAELRTWREEDRVKIAALERTVELLLAGSPLNAPAGEASPARRVPQRSAG